MGLLLENAGRARRTCPKGQCSNIGEVRSYLPKVAAELIEDYKPYLPEVAVEQILSLCIGYGADFNHQPYLSKVAREQVEDTGLIFLKLQEAD
ncbi:Histidine--tRNA ligase [Gossypium arboreum]|uniref:Histidine--tRNA ligase n=1 Tax=Gossypium arboreum TaxID=29729 RepID=A0A0B0P980_GOSAR|nr:Histidine--tRNA ligase [Gossypium arboreum]